MNSGLKLADRSVHILIEPNPSTLHERRAILRVLRQFGDVVFFKWLGKEARSTNKTILAVFASPESAEKLFTESPLEFQVEPPRPPKPNSSLATLEILQPPKADDAESPGSKAASQQHGSLQPREKHFYLRADASRADVAGRIRRHPFHGPYSLKKKTFAQADLAQVVPLEALSVVEANPEQMQQRVARSIASKAASSFTLRQLWERGRQSDQAAT